MAKNHYFDTSAVENTIFNLVVASEKNYEYPSLQKEAVDIISNNITKVVYETLKQKSIASSTKRCNLLKFLNNSCQTREHHFDKNNYKLYLKAYEEEFCKFKSSEIDNLVHDISQELNSCSTDLKKDIISFYKIKNVKRQQRNKKLEFIKQHDQEKLNLTLGMQVSRNISHYETNENLVNELLVENSTESNKNEGKLAKLNEDSKEYREKQIKFCYALMNLGAKEDMQILRKMLQKISKYKNFAKCELGFLIDLWLYSDEAHFDINTTITEYFPFIVEKTIIQFCTEIVKLKDDLEVSKYFTDLETNPKILRLRSICLQNLSFYCKMKSFIFELYILSYCNENLYRFADYII